MDNENKQEQVTSDENQDNSIIESEIKTSSSKENKIQNNDKENDKQKNNSTQNTPKIVAQPIAKENYGDGKSFNVVIEEKRSALMKSYKKNKLISTISMAVVVGLMIGCFVLISQKNNRAAQISGYVMAGVAVVGLIAYWIISKNKFPNLTKEYIGVVTLLIDSHVYNNQEYTEMFYYPNEKEDKTEILADRVYKEVADIGSRNVTRGKFNKHSFRSSEVAAYHAGDKKKKVLSFLGRYVTTTNDLRFDGRVILTISSKDKPTDLPTDTEGMYKDENPLGLTIYCDEGAKDYENILGDKFLTTFAKKFQTNKYLLGVSIVIWAGKSSAYFSYEDGVIALPFDKPFLEEPLQQGISDLYNILKLFDYLRK